MPITRGDRYKQKFRIVQKAVRIKIKEYDKITWEVNVRNIDEGEVEVKIVITDKWR